MNTTRQVIRRNECTKILSTPSFAVLQYRQISACTKYGQFCASSGATDFSCEEHSSVQSLSSAQKFPSFNSINLNPKERTLIYPDFEEISFAASLEAVSCR
jgi:hypothetical protein